MADKDMDTSTDCGAGEKLVMRHTGVPSKWPMRGMGMIVDERKRRFWCRNTSGHEACDHQPSQFSPLRKGPIRIAAHTRDHLERELIEYYRTVYPDCVDWVYPLLPRLERQGFTVSTVLSSRADRMVWYARDERGDSYILRILTVTEEEKRIFHRRYSVLTRVRHRSCETIRECLELSPNHLAIVSDYVSGVSLQTVLKSRGSLLLGELSTLIDQVASALAALHRESLVHGDLSPHNIICTPDGELRLIDFFSRPSEVGTQGFSSPQVEQGQRPTWHDDVYSLARIVQVCSDPADWEYDRVRWNDALSESHGDRPSAISCALRTIPGISPMPIDVPERELLAAEMIRSQAAAPTRVKPMTISGTGRKRKAFCPRLRMTLIIVTAVFSVVTGGVAAALVTHHDETSRELYSLTHSILTNRDTQHQEERDSHRADPIYIASRQPACQDRGEQCQVQSLIRRWLAARDNALRGTDDKSSSRHHSDSSLSNNDDGADLWGKVFAFECPASAVIDQEKTLRDQWEGMAAQGLVSRVLFPDDDAKDSAGNREMSGLGMVEYGPEERGEETLNRNSWGSDQGELEGNEEMAEDELIRMTTRLSHQPYTVFRLSDDPSQMSYDTVRTVPAVDSRDVQVIVKHQGDGRWCVWDVVSP
ncbi:serine/threonine protein kinase [Actinomyces vulturis]|uniref:serine/threonine protein kinase n=1 Tax=Actinomyces vulturis TaxID=1857645 RepID=UPI00083372FB|nr:protein kinase [Actinomyces vulturis]